MEVAGEGHREGTKACHSRTGCSRACRENSYNHTPVECLTRYSSLNNALQIRAYSRLLWLTTMVSLPWLDQLLLATTCAVYLHVLYTCNSQTSCSTTCYMMLTCTVSMACSVGDHTARLSLPPHPHSGHACCWDRMEGQVHRHGIAGRSSRPLVHRSRNRLPLQTPRPLWGCGSWLQWGGRTAAHS